MGSSRRQRRWATKGFVGAPLHLEGFGTDGAGCCVQLELVQKCSIEHCPSCAPLIVPLVGLWGGSSRRCASLLVVAHRLALVKSCLENSYRYRERAGMAVVQCTDYIIQVYAYLICADITVRLAPDRARFQRPGISFVAEPISSPQRLSAMGSSTLCVLSAYYVFQKGLLPS